MRVIDFLKKRRQAFALGITLACLALLYRGGLSDRVPQWEYETQGLVVEEVTPGSAGQASGLKRGDLLLSWTRKANEAFSESAGAPFRSPFDWYVLEQTQAPIGPIELKVRRKDGDFQAAVGDGEWGVVVRGLLHGRSLKNYRKGRDALRAGKLEKGSLILKAFAADRAQKNETQTAVWALANLALYLEGNKLRSEAAKTLVLALEHASAEKPATLAWLRNRCGLDFNFASDFETSKPILQAGLGLATDSTESTLLLGHTHYYLAFIDYRAQNYQAALDHYDRAYKLMSPLAPKSHITAKTLASRAFTYQKLELNAEATRDLEAALVLFERHFPEDGRIIRILADLGRLNLLHGDFLTAEKRLQRSLQLNRERGGADASAVDCWTNLGHIANFRRDFSLAIENYRKARQAADRVGDKSLLHIENGLGLVYAEEENWEAADEHFQRAVALAKAAGDGENEARSWINMAEMALKRERYDQARTYFRAAEDAVPPDRRTNRGLEAMRFMLLGRLDRRAQRFETAQSSLQESLRLYESPDDRHFGYVLTLYECALLARDRGEKDRAYQYLERAVASLETQLAQLGGGDLDQAKFMLGFQNIYRDLIAVSLEKGNKAQAYAWNERYRGQIFLKNLYQREAIDTRKVPQELSQRILDLRDRLNRLETQKVANPKHFAQKGSQAELERVELALQQARSERARYAVDLSKYKEIPKWDIAMTQAVLDEGTLLLSFSVHEDGVNVFAVDKRRFEVLHSDLTETALKRQVEDYLNRLTKSPPGNLQDLNRRAFELYRHLLEPLAGRIDAAERILIAADGPLHGFPFAALVCQDPTTLTAGETALYLARKKPLHQAISMPVYDRFLKKREAPAEPQGPSILAAFGDPKIPPGLEVLVPATRFEVERIAKFFPGQKPYTGAEASEARAKSLKGEFEVVHFATHAKYEPGDPLGSFLVLSEGQGDDGLLRAYEVLDEMRLQSNLIVLAACDTAVGKDLGGEGLLSLARAFQYAGARSIVATLWPVEDEATLSLMERFYECLDEGKSKDLALKAAQQTFMDHESWSHPAFWAGFVLIGDWK